MIIQGTILKHLVFRYNNINLLLQWLLAMAFSIISSCRSTSWNKVQQSSFQTKWCLLLFLRKCTNFVATDTKQNVVWHIFVTRPIHFEKYNHTNKVYTIQYTKKITFFTVHTSGGFTGLYITFKKIINYLSYSYASYMVTFQDSWA